MIRLVILASALLSGCAAGDTMRRPDYVEIHAGHGWGDWSGDGHATGPPGPGQDASIAGDSTMQTVGLTLGWTLAIPGASALDRLDASHEAWMASAAQREADSAVVADARDQALAGALVALREVLAELPRRIRAAMPDRSAPAEARAATEGDGGDSDGSSGWIWGGGIGATLAALAIRFGPAAGAWALALIRARFGADDAP